VKPRAARGTLAPATKNEIAQLLAILDQAYDKPSWHGTNLRGSIRRVTPEQAAWRPGPGRHNIWEIVVHAAYWKYAAARRLTDGARGSFPLKGSNWFERPAEPGQSRDKPRRARLRSLDLNRASAWQARVRSPDLNRASAWHADRNLLDEMHSALRAALMSLSARDLSRTPPGKKVSNFAVLSGVAAHDLYHAGQIQLLKRLSHL
jgi:hypothetical protein